MLVLSAVFAYHAVFPFNPVGTGMILISDFWQQYFPFISDFWHRLRGGNSLLWSWTAGGGHNYIANIAYYKASPFNVLAALFPHSVLREVLQVFLVVKIGCAGAAMCAYLHRTTGKLDRMLPVFATFYALCGFTLAYYWNVMWMDTFALLPVVMLGVHALVTAGKYRLFVLSLAAAIIFNFYMGIFVCIFVAFKFFMLSIVHKLGLRDFAVKLGIIAAASIAGIGMTAFITLPTFVALQHTYNAVNNVNSVPDAYFYSSFFDVLGNFFVQHHHNLRHAPEALPSLYTGLLPLMLLPVFLLSDKIILRERLTYAAVLAFMVVSVNHRLLNFMWHGFSFTHALPFRYTFLISFVLIVMAYRAYLVLDTTRPRDIYAMAAGGIFFAAMAVIGRQDADLLGWNLVLIIIYLLLFAVCTLRADESPAPSGNAGKLAAAAAILRRIQRILTASAVPIVMTAVIIVELTLSANAAVYSNRVSSRQPYPWMDAEVQELLTHRASADNDFFRTEFHRWWSTNDSTLYGYAGLSIFTSMMDARLGYFVQGLGLPYRGRANSINYAETSPLTNAFLNLRYLMHRSGWLTDRDVFWQEVHRVDGVTLLRNNYYLPLGFMVGDAVADYSGNLGNPFASQNDLFARATGLEGELFSFISPAHQHTNYTVSENEPGSYRLTRIDGATDGTARFDFTMPREGCIYGFIRLPGSTRARIYANDSEIGTVEIDRSSYLFRIGSFSYGDVVSLAADTSRESETVPVFAAVIDHGLFAQGHALLSSETLNLTLFTDTRIQGRVTTAGGLLYTSIPHADNWRVRVNGAAADVVLIDGAMVGVRLPAGEHLVEFIHVNTGFITGAAISGLSLLLFLAVSYLPAIKSRRNAAAAGS